MSIPTSSINQAAYTYQLSDSGSCILRSNSGMEMSDTLLILPDDSDLIIKNTDNMGGSLVLTCGDNALIEGILNSITFSGLSVLHLLSFGGNWWIIF